MVLLTKQHYAMIRGQLYPLRGWCRHNRECFVFKKSAHAAFIFHILSNWCLVVSRDQR